MGLGYQRDRLVYMVAFEKINVDPYVDPLYASPLGDAASEGLAKMNWTFAAFAVLGTAAFLWVKKRA